MHILQVVSPSVSARLAYITEIVFEQLLGLKVVFTNTPAAELPVLYYSPKPPITNILWLEASDILFQNNIEKQNINVENTGQYVIFFKTENPKSILDFDVLAASFYLISRYEEYTDPQRDAHGRFTAEQSLAFRQNFLHLPIIEYWATLLQKKLENAFPTLVYTRQKGRVWTTFDIDIAWAFRHKTVLQYVGAVVSDILKLDFKTLKYRFSVWQNTAPDPFFCFDTVEEILKNNVLSQNNSPTQNTTEMASIFWLLGKYGEYDKNTPIETPEFRTLIQHFAQKFTVGIHPSYRSNTENGRLSFEIQSLNAITTQQTRHSRQHFLKLNLPKTYQNLIKNGITHDYSMGYAEQIGFRAGISQPFAWFDLSENRKTGLTILPFCIMDVTLRQYLQVSPENAVKMARILINDTTALGGQAVLLWHNSSLSDYNEWRGWRRVLHDILDDSIFGTG